MKLAQAEIDSFPEKGRKNQEILELYKERDFLTAYALHTDSRVTEHGYRSAVGSVDDWERHGKLQSEFLISSGLKPNHSLLDIGCGTGRLARKIVPYLSDGQYVGVDISSKAIAYAARLSQEEGWATGKVLFVRNLDSQDTFDYLWAFSVFVHLPCEIMQDVMRTAASCMHKSSRFYFSCVPEKVEARSGPKSFRHTLSCYKNSAQLAGLKFDIDYSWKGEQKIALAMIW